MDFFKPQKFFLSFYFKMFPILFEWQLMEERQVVYDDRTSIFIWRRLLKMLQAEGR